MFNMNKFQSSSIHITHTYSSSTSVVVVAPHGRSREIAPQHRLLFLGLELGTFGTSILGLGYIGAQAKHNTKYIYIY